MILTMEGLMSESYEDAYGTDAYREPTHSDEDERYYVEFILSGLHDDEDADRGAWAEDTYDPDFREFPSEREMDRAEDSYLRQFGW